MFKKFQAAYQFGKTVAKKLKGNKQKTTGTEVVKSVKPAVHKSKFKQAITDVKLTALKAKNKMKRSFQKMEEDIDPARTKLRQTTQKLKGEKVTKSGISKGKDLREKRMGGGMMGRRMGYATGTQKKNFSKLPEAVQMKIDKKLAKEV